MEERTFTYSTELCNFAARWKFNRGESGKLVAEFLEVTTKFDDSNEWYWYHDGEVELINLIHEVARQEVDHSELLELLDCYGIYPTTKAQKNTAIEAQIKFVNHMVFVGWSEYGQESGIES